MYVIEAILPQGTISKGVIDAITWLGYLNSAINPIIYAFCSKQFRSAFYRVTFGKFSSSTKKDQFTYFYNNNIANYYTATNRPSQSIYYQANNSMNNANYAIYNPTSNSVKRAKIVNTMSTKFGNI